jgi:group II intron reverse transcriptase/maturase
VKGKQRAFDVSREEVLSAWHRVKAKGGKGGVDGESIKGFESKLEDNLYKLWNRMSSGSYHPKAVLRVEIPKGKGEKRELGIPTILDRVAQQVVRARLEQVLEPIFHRDSYGYRRNQSAPAAVRSCRARCWSYDWVLDVDIQRFFDTIDHELMLKAVRHHCSEEWMVMYIERWLKAAVKHKDGSSEQPTRGTPQGGVISPLLANLYLHYTFDLWMGREFPGVEFERYADDAVIHCRTEEQAKVIEHALAERLKECGLTLHPKKTKIVYCKDGTRRCSYPEQRFKFLGYTFEKRSAQNRQTGKRFLRFLPAMSQEAGKSFRENLKGKKCFYRTQCTVEQLAAEVNPVVRGFYNYFRHFYPSKLYRLNDWLNQSLVRWWRKKTKSTWKQANGFLQRLSRQYPRLFYHWTFRLPGRAV